LINTPRQVLFASLIGTTIEFFDFYIYATAAVLVFPKLFFPSTDPTAATLASLATFALAFVARPIGSALFGHFGDRVGRKATLVAALLTMGLSTVIIGMLPTYATIGIAAPALLALCRVGQGLGLSGVFLLLSQLLTNEQFFAFGWRIPFLASAVLVFVGLYVRLTITETPVFRDASVRHERVKIPMLTVFRDHGGTLAIGILVSLSAFVLFYFMTVFALSWGTSALGYSRDMFLKLQLVAILFFALTIPLSAVIADRGGRRTAIWMNLGVFLFGLVMAPMFEAGTIGAASMLIVGMALMGTVYGPLGTLLSELFPTRVRYSGTSLAFNIAGIFGASLAPYAATYLAATYGLRYVGYYLSASAVLTLVGLALAHETKDAAL
jgi:MFS family permease